VYTASLSVWLFLPWHHNANSVGAWVTTLGIYLTRIAVTVALMSAWKLWRPAGFLTALTWRRLSPALPLLVIPAYQLIVGPGMPDRPAWEIAVVTFGVLTVAFGEEGVFRGLVLRLLLQRGLRPAIFGSAALFGLMHLVNLANGAPAISVASQVLMTFGIGIGFGAVALASGTIWPLVAIHFLMDVNYSIQASAAGDNLGATVSTSDLLLNGGISVFIGLLAAGYGLWLLRHRVGLLRALGAGTSWPATTASNLE
jgi:membrane protease YdiL (CAAX protease family)